MLFDPTPTSKLVLTTSKTLNLFSRQIDPLRFFIFKVPTMAWRQVAKMIKVCANITGGGLKDNISRVIPKGLSAEIDLSKIKTLEIFRWIKRFNITDKEMIKTFNCGVGFCIVINKNNLNKINKFFNPKFKPYVIGKIIKDKKSVILNGKIDWSK